MKRLVRSFSASRSAWLFLALLLAGTACRSENRDRVARTTVPSASTAAKFCVGWAAAYPTGDEARLKEVLRDAPPEIADAAKVIRESTTANDEEATAAVYAVSAWVETNCQTASRHVAPPAGADLAGLSLCSLLSMPQVPASDAPPEEHVVLYGEADRAEPYDGPMIGVFTNQAGPNDYLGDGDQTAIRVRGKPGKSAPISVFQQAILPELGTVIAWTEDGHGVGLYGRLWPEARTAELIALAERLELVDGRFVLPADALPDGYREVFAGSPDANWSIAGSTLIGTYQLRYQADTGPQNIVTLAGQQLAADQFDTFRFFAFPVPHVRIAGRDVLFGSLWSENDGPYIATWREPDGFTVRITGIGASREQVRAVAAQSRELDPAEWKQLVGSAKECKQGP